MSRDEGTWLMPTLSLAIALTLSVLSLPRSIEAFRPDWVAMVLLYWSLIAPHRYGLLSAMFMGLALDALTGSLLGQHGLALLVIVYISQRFHWRIRAFPASQVALIVIGLLMLYEFILFWIDGVAGRTVPSIERWAPVISGAVLWIVVLAGLQRNRYESETRMS
jgi:rod shape-determining protein MreD